MSLNVLIVDDSGVMRKSILRILKICGLPLGEVTQAGNGQEALAVLDEHWVDLALVDINMPVMNGIEFIEAARQRPDSKDLLFIVVSTEGSATRIAQLEEMGVSFIHKPFKPETVRGKIAAMTGVADGPDTLAEPAVQHSDLDF